MAMSKQSDINQTLKRTNIKGREYVEVNQRILAFWELFPNGSIVTTKLSDDGKRCDFKAEVSVDGRLVATGHAFEFQGSGMVNKTSYVENCETSAVGRALAMLGIGIAESLASADEVENAMSHQEQAEEPVAQTIEHDASIRAAKGRMWSAIKRWAELHGRIPEEVLEGVKKRPDWVDTAEFFNSTAQEFEVDLNG